MLVAPSLGYLVLSPMLIVFAGAVLGVLVEAFMGKTHRAAVQFTISVGVLLLSLQQLWRIRDISSTTAAVDSVTIDKAGIFLQATVVLLALNREVVFGHRRSQLRLGHAHESEALLRSRLF